jgi:zinc protease
MATRSLIRCIAFLCGLLVAQAAQAILPIEHWRTASGAKVYFVANRGLPMVDVSVEFPAGAAFDRADRTGVAAFTNSLMRLGVKGLGEEQIEQRLADNGAILGSRFDNDRSGYTLRTLSEPRWRNEPVQLMARILAAPEFPQDVLTRERSRLLASLKEAERLPATIAGREFQRAVFGGHPYGRRAYEIETLDRIGRDDLAAFHRSHFVADRAVVAIMGDVTRAEAEAIAEQLTRDLPRGSGPAALPDPAPLAAPIERNIAHPATQSHILVGAPGLRRSDPDFFAFLLGNHILGGGGFVSRINEEVRQKRGLAYSAYSTFAPTLSAGAFTIGLQTQRDQAGEALSVVRKTLADFIANGPTDKELAAAKQNIVGGFPMRIDSNRKIHEHLGLIGFYDLPLDYLERFVPSIERVTAAEIRTAFARRIDPARLVTVVVGPEAPATP